MEIHWGCLTPAPQGGWGPDCQFLLTLLLGSLLSPRAWRVWGWGECSGPGFPCRAQDGRHSVKSRRQKALGTENNSWENIFKGCRKARALRIGTNMEKVPKTHWASLRSRQVQIPQSDSTNRARILRMPEEEALRQEAEWLRWAH